MLKELGTFNMPAVGGLIHTRVLTLVLGFQLVTGKVLLSTGLLRVWVSHGGTLFEGIADFVGGNPLLGFTGAWPLTVLEL
jgi:hypothetical protein